MTSTTSREKERLIPLIAEAIEKANVEWQEGRATSPSQLDYVIDADRILTAELPTYGGSTEEGREFVADVLYEDAGATWDSAEMIAAYLYDVLTAE